MGWYTPQLLQTNAGLMTAGSQMQSKALQGMLGSATGDLNDLSDYRAEQEDNAYRSLLAQHMNSFQHQNPNTENERINPMMTADGHNINDYRTNATDLVRGITAGRAGSIFAKAIQNRVLQAQNQQNLLNSHIKQTGQDQTTSMNNYINSVGDANKDGLIDYRDMNPTEQTALQGLYSSVSKGLLDKANQNQNFLSQQNIKNKYLLKREDARFNHNKQVTQISINAKQHQLDVSKKIALMSSYQTQIQSLNKQLTPYYSMATSQMTPDMKANMQNLLQRKNMLSGYISNLQGQIGGQTQVGSQSNTPTIGGSSLLNTAPQPSLTSEYTQPQVTSQPSIFNKNQHAPTQVTHSVKQSNYTRPLTGSDMNIPNGTNAQVTKAIEETGQFRKNYNEVVNKTKDNLYFNLIRNGIAEKANKNVKSSSAVFIPQDTNAIKNTIKTAQEHLDYMDKKGFDPETGFTSRLYALRQKSKLENAIAYAKEHGIKIDDSAKKLMSIFDGFLNRSGNMKDYHTNIYVEGFNSLLHTKDSITGDKSTFMHPAGVDRTMTDFGKVLFQHAPDYSNNRYGDGGLHSTMFMSDDYAKQIATKALPTLKDYIAKNIGASSNQITDDMAQEWLYNQLGDPSTNELDYMGSLSRFAHIGSLNNQVVNKKGSFNLQGFLNILKAQKAK